MSYFDVTKMLQCEDFPVIEMILSESSNVNGDTVYAHAVERFNKQSEGMRLAYLAKLLPSERLLQPVVINGFSYSPSDKWTIADAVVKDKMKYDVDDQFEVIWLENECIQSEYHGYAGYSVRRLRGIVLHYPDEISKAA